MEEGFCGVATYYTGYKLQMVRSNLLRGLHVHSRWAVCDRADEGVAEREFGYMERIVDRYCSEHGIKRYGLSLGYETVIPLDGCQVDRFRNFPGYWLFGLWIECGNGDMELVERTKGLMESFARVDRYSGSEVEPFCAYDVVGRSNFSGGMPSDGYTFRRFLGSGVVKVDGSRYVLRWLGEWSADSVVNDLRDHCYRLGGWNRGKRCSYFLDEMVRLCEYVRGFDGS
jgi:hypothetical protein